MRIPGLYFAFLLLASCAGRSGEHPGVDTPGGSVVAPKSDTERQVLGLLDSLPAGTPRQVGGATVVADAPYFAASGRACRELTISQAGKAPGPRRLACQDGTAWHYVPTVVVGPAGAEP